MALSFQFKVIPLPVTEVMGVAAHVGAVGTDGGVKVNILLEPSAELFKLVIFPTANEVVTGVVAVLLYAGVVIMVVTHPTVFEILLEEKKMDFVAAV